MTAIPEQHEGAVSTEHGHLLPQSEHVPVVAAVPLTPDSPINVVSDDVVSSASFNKEEDGKTAAIEGTIDPRFVLPKCPQFDTEDKDFKPVVTFVTTAVASRHDDSNSNSNRGYCGILDAFRKGEDSLLLCKVLLVLRGSTLHQLSGNPKGHAHLLHLIFRLDPFVIKERPNSKKKLPNVYSLADSHLHLLVALVSANSIFLNPAMNAIWRLLVCVPPPPMDEQDRTTAAVDTTERTRRLHAALATMVRLCPKGNSELFPIVASNFPFRTKPTNELVAYTQQCLAILTYVPTLHSQVLELLLDKCLEMDVEIKIDDGGKVSIDSSTHNAEDVLFELEIDGSDKNNNGDDKSMKDTAGGNTNTSDEQQVDEMADKLDSLMTILLQHIQTYSAEHGAEALYRMVSPVFDASILTTHRSKFVQFVLLVLCGLEHEQLDDDAMAVGSDSRLDREFAAKLIDIVLDPYRATVTRQSGACYLASFVSRALFVSAETACEAISALLRWAEAYMMSDYATRASDLREQCDLHSLFYTVCQASFYIMCFRGSDAMGYYRSAMDYHARHHHHAGDIQAASEEEVLYADPEHVNIGPERWTMICGHELQPLKFCLESVRGEFLHVAGVYRLLPVPLLDRLSADDSKMSTHSKARKVAIITTAATLAKQRLNGGVGGIGRGSNPLDSFFPYDPYLLCRSHRFVEPFYKNWEGSIEEDGGFADMNCDEDDDGQEEEDDVLSVDEESTSSIDDEDEDDDDTSTHMPQSVDSRVQPTSFASNATITSTSTKSSLQPATPGATELKKQVPREAWSETLKRARAPSIENGSW